MTQDNKPKFQPQQKLVIPRAIVEDVAYILCHLLTNSLQSSDRYNDIATLTESERAGISHLGTLMSKYEIVPKNMVDWLKDIIKLVLEEEHKQNLSAFRTFSTRCPYCGQERCIMIIRATLTHTGKVLRPKVALQSDGFNISSYHKLQEKDMSTENEQVRCDNCKTKFDLSALIL